MDASRHPSMTFDERYRAISSRDTRFDGQFVTAVRTTGIYCRPSCPARTPMPANVSFFATSAAAHEAGYRACKRCLPEAAPGSPEWDLRRDAAGRAMRLIFDGVIEREGVSGLAARLGYSPRHLTRMLTAELGAGPLALARAQRAHTARMLLAGTDLTAAEVAFSAGFTSVRQFNDTVREVFGLTPTELRARVPAAPCRRRKRRVKRRGKRWGSGWRCRIANRSMRQVFSPGWRPARSRVWRLQHPIRSRDTCGSRGVQRGSVCVTCPGSVATGTAVEGTVASRSRSELPDRPTSGPW